MTALRQNLCACELTAVLSASMLSLISIPLFGHLSDRIGRENMYMIGAAATGVFGFIYFAMLSSGSEAIIFLAVILSLVPHDVLYGPQAALIADSIASACATAAPRLAISSPPSAPADPRL